MTAARIVGSRERSVIVDLTEVQRELSQLHILLLGISADTEDVLSPVRPVGGDADLRRGVRRALACLDALRERLQKS
jgi:hypothetical protein